MVSEVISVLLGVLKFWNDVKSFIAFRQKYSDTQWKNEGSVLTKAIQGATTDDERAKLIHALATHMSSA